MPAISFHLSRFVGELSWLCDYKLDYWLISWYGGLWRQTLNQTSDGVPVNLQHNQITSRPYEGHANLWSILLTQTIYNDGEFHRFSTTKPRRWWRAIDAKSRKQIQRPSLRKVHRYLSMNRKIAEKLSFWISQDSTQSKPLQHQRPLSHQMIAFDLYKCSKLLYDLFSIRLFQSFAQPKTRTKQFHLQFGWNFVDLFNEYNIYFIKIHLV